MLRATLMGTALLIGLSGCARIADSRLNPFNWFGNSQPAAVVDASERRPLVPEGRRTVIVDNRALLQTVDAMSVDRAPAGAIVRATGTAPGQGYFNAQLVSRGVANGVLTLEFRAQAPSAFEGIGPNRSRQITAAYVIDAAELAAIRSVRIEAASNARVSRR